MFEHGGLFAGRNFSPNIVAVVFAWTLNVTICFKTINSVFYYFFLYYCFNKIYKDGDNTDTKKVSVLYFYKRLINDPISRLILSSIFIK